MNGQTTAADLGLGKLMATRKDFIGAAMAARPGLTSHERPTLVGFKPVNPLDPVSGGAHFIRPGAKIDLRSDEGHVTSTAWSATLGSTIGLGLLKRGPQRHGERVRAFDPMRGRDTLVEVCSPHFVDPGWSASSWLTWLPSARRSSVALSLCDWAHAGMCPACCLGACEPVLPTRHCPSGPRRRCDHSGRRARYCLADDA